MDPEITDNQKIKKVLNTSLEAANHGGIWVKPMLECTLKEPTTDKALRYDSGKVRHDLLPAHALNELAKVYTMGAKKYADNNWRKGMKWSRVLGSLKRHLNYIENGQDYDEESKLLHAAHVAWNAITLLEYYKIYPQGDDRQHIYLDTPKIGLDIDEVLADFVGGMMERFPDMKERSIYWNDPYINEHFNEIKNDEEFWLNLKCKIKHDEIPFEPHCYITARPISTELTKQWLKNNGFPDAPVYTVAHGMSKIQVAKDSGITWFVDDRFENFVELNKAGICTFLLNAPHNERYDVGYKRICSLKELIY